MARNSGWRNRRACSPGEARAGGGTGAKATPIASAAAPASTVNARNTAGHPARSASATPAGTTSTTATMTPRLSWAIALPSRAGPTMRATAVLPMLTKAGSAAPCTARTAAITQ
jgi:hypothetical protein